MIELETEDGTTLELCLGEVVTIVRSPERVRPYREERRVRVVGTKRGALVVQAVTQEEET